MTYTGSYAADRWLILNEDGTEFGAFSTQAARDEVLDALASRTQMADTRPCTCHPDDNPPVPCPRKYALSDCRQAARTETADV